MGCDQRPHPGAARPVGRAGADMQLIIEGVDVRTNGVLDVNAGIRAA
jgi:hypothetical protein